MEVMEEELIVEEKKFNILKVFHIAMMLIIVLIAIVLVSLNVSFNKKEEVYVYSDEELKEITKGKSMEDLQRYKGLGEMDAEQLWDTTMDPAKRTLIRVNITDAVLAEKRVSVLMGEKVEPRKVWIEENVEFSLEDDYQIK